MSQNPIIYIAGDTPNLEKIKNIAAIAVEAGQGLKLGLEFFNCHGPEAVRGIRETFPDISIFLDLKYHDIPNTVEGALREISKVGIDYINVHASGGMEMMKRALNGAQEGAEAAGIKPPKVLAVTVLTSLDIEDLELMGIANHPSEQVLRLAQLTKDAGLAGIVCSSMEIELVRRQLGKDFILMVPGIRPAGSDKGDQKRIMTPKDAMTAGATHLVIGRPITGAADPKQAIEDILETLK